MYNITSSWCLDEVSKKNFNGIINDIINGFEETAPVNKNVAVDKTEKGVTLNWVFPGITKENFSVKVVDGVLTIATVETENTKENKYYKTLKYTYKLDGKSDVDNIKASYEAGVLSVVIPFKEEFVKETVVNVS